MYNIVSSIASTSNIDFGKKFLHTDEADTVIIIILNENSIRFNSSESVTKQQKFIRKTYVSTLLSTIVQKKHINEALFKFSCYIQNKIRTKKEYCIVIKNPKHIEIYSYKSFMYGCDREDGNHDEEAEEEEEEKEEEEKKGEESICEWTTKRYLNSLFMTPKRKKNLKSRYVFIFTSQYKPSILQHFVKNISTHLFIKIMYITREESVNASLDDLLEHFPYNNCTIKILIQRLKSNNRF
uniref:Uncharacterized protein n=1 Tax=Penaeus monodon majanivirus B TaxID=2984272 RepID=A0A9C7BYQ2_9VIRU|nr:MAG: hypothetical protein [Penaeus monodon majanivirus B]